ncbi:SP_1767 family glycosyltransferase [Alicyclobacillus ferrooxydans]|uniref:Glycosyl transferase family 8 n=1 Tax=Alicyclobacillus ferrooxydans TaxID=471514 RepID=A0A0N8PMP7_9BACL|nr:SP_1767 family glycosyltransferase [Alicyclobacillus ferrooxydans]KPV39317.1 glycosyl transferase family 8 [Alicyclobacillus ferrooxydans]
MSRFFCRVQRFITVRMFNWLLSLLVKPRVRNTDETLNKVAHDRVSISRFGDGEFKIMEGESLFFQESEPILRMRLQQVLRAKLDNHIVGIPDVFGSIERFTDKSKYHWKRYLRYNRFTIYKMLDWKKEYYDALMTRLYIDHEDKSKARERFDKLKKLWDKREVLIIEGSLSRLGVGNDLFANAKTIERILCPSKNAFSMYQEILREATKNSKNKLILIALGPTATVLAYDLTRYGFQAVDVGHIDIEYEWFLRGVVDKSVVKKKYVNEVPLGDQVEEVCDNKYDSEVISRIS